MIATLLLSACLLDAPATGCKLGNATVAAPYEPGASYTWSVEGATILAGDGTSQIVLALGDGDSARVRLNDACETTIALRAPLAIANITVPSTADAGQPVTIHWSYEGDAAPSSQVLFIDDLDEPVVLDAAARSYTWTASIAGTKNVELRASAAMPVEVVPSTGRRRAVAPVQSGTATPCPVATKSAQFEVRGCGIKPPKLVAPESVEAGATFTASTEAAVGQTIQWRVTNGTIVSGAGTSSIRVQASDLESSLRLRVEISSGPECSAQTTRDLPIVPRAVCNSTTPPAVSLAMKSTSCGRATVEATFTGTAPFRGEWSDGTKFETSSLTLTHDFTVAGVYSIDDFRDAVCRGAVTQTARADALRPTAVLTTRNGSCESSTVVARFAGTPPFKGRWSDGVTFTTSEMQLEHKGMTPSWRAFTIDELTDAVCSQSAPHPANEIEVLSNPTAYFLDDVYCSTTGKIDVWAHAGGGDGPPFTVTFSDGVVATSEAGRPEYVRRSFDTKSYATPLRITAVGSKTCKADEDDTATMSYRPAPKIVEKSGADVVACDGIGLVNLVTSDMHPDLNVVWSIDTGVITAGQGTPHAEFKMPWGGSGALVRATATYPDGYCSNRLLDERFFSFGTAGKVYELSVSRDKVLRGGTVAVYLAYDQYVRYADVTVSPSSRADDLHYVVSDGLSREYSFKDTHGPGVVTITVNYGGYCMQPASKSVSFTIE